MKLSKEARALADDLGLSEADAAIMELKAELYRLAAKSIKRSKLTHEEIAEKVGTSRARITRISNLGESSLSMELLVRVIVCVENKIPLKVA